MSRESVRSTPQAGSFLPEGKRSDLIDLVVGVLYSVKAHDLPTECERLGLPGGTENEAFLSKRGYVRRRMQDLRNDHLLQLARQVEQKYVEQKYDCFSLTEFLRLLDELDNGQAITELTRRSIFKAINRIELFGELPLVDQLSKLWPLCKMFSRDFGGNLEDSVRKHCVDNEDWSNADLLEAVGALNCSRTLFFSLLESIVSPYARRGEEQARLVDTLNTYLKEDGYHLRPSGSISGHTDFSVDRIGGGVTGVPKNLIFASSGPKPEIVLQDAINNDIRIVRNGEFCLVYDRPIHNTGLSKGQILSWWKDREGIDDDVEARRKLYERLSKSLKYDGERNLFNVYYRTVRNLGDQLPAMIPQVYLHYDPYTLRDLGGVGRLPRQRMDFLLLFSDTVRVVVEVDGPQHFTGDDGKPSLAKYAEMVAADRDLRLAGYEVYRFGVNELTGNGYAERIKKFFQQLLQKHGISEFRGHNTKFPGEKCIVSP